MQLAVDNSIQCIQFPNQRLGGLYFHTYYSLRYGTMSIEELVNEAVKQGITKLVMADINNTSAVFDFVALCQKNDIEPVVGVDFRNENEQMYLCLAKNEEGFSEINTFLTSHNMSTLPFPQKAPAFKHVFVIYPFRILSKIERLAENEYIGVRLTEVNKLWNFNSQIGFKFGKGIKPGLLNNGKQNAENVEARKVLNCEISLSKSFVVLQPVTFLNRQGFNIHRLLRAIDENCLLSKLPKESQAAEDEHFHKYDDVEKAFANHPEILENHAKLIAQCSFSFDFNTPKNKSVFTATKPDDYELIKKLTWDGYLYRYGKDNKEAKARVGKELKIIYELNFCAYFLITWDIIRYARSRGYFHVGRGSGANSIVAYCLGITDVDPIELDLYFERFINPFRTSPPDFDIDFSWDERDEIIDYVFKRYGAEYVCLLATYVTFKDRSAYRELGKVFGLPKHEIDVMIGSGDYKNQQVIANSQHPATSSQPAAIIDLVYKYGKLMEDFPNYLSIHAGGIMVSEKPLSYYTALAPMPKGFPICQFDMYVAEDVGFAKFDVLSQRGLGHIKESVDIIFKNRQINVDVHAIQKFKDDPNIKDQMRRHETMGCFYIESPAMRQLIWKLTCDNYITLVAASSIIRPGVASSGMMKAFIERYHDPEKVEYIHPKMKDLLQETYGVMVYQEDVIKVAHHFAGLTLAEADVLRRAMSGKYRSRLEFQKIIDKWFENCKAYGYPDDIAKEVWRQIESFSGYSFSKAHSASFAVESYQSLFLKTYYPREFMVAVINNFGGFYRTEFYIHEARRCGALVEAPDINKSNYLTHIEGDTIWLGWVHIKGLERKLAQWIVDEANALTFRSFDDFCRRVPTGLEQLILLIRVGAFRSFGYSKKELLWQAHISANSKATYISSGDLFELPDTHYEFPKLVHEPLEDTYDELELLGFPMVSPFQMLINMPVTCFHALNMMPALGKWIELVGYMVTVKPTRTKKGERMGFGYFIDANGEFFDTVHFPKSYAMYPYKGWGVYHMKGIVMEEFGHCNLQVIWMEKLAMLPDPRMG